MSENELQNKRDYQELYDDRLQYGDSKDARVITRREFEKDMNDWVYCDTHPQIGNHLETEEAVLAEIERLRASRKKQFSRKWEHTLYTRYSNRITKLKKVLWAVGIETPKAIRRDAKPKNVAASSLYGIYLEMYRTEKITREKFLYYTRPNNGVQPSPEEKKEHDLIIASHVYESNFADVS